MEIVVYPRTYGITPGKVGDADVVRITVQDAGAVAMTPQGPLQTPGPMVTLVFAASDWEQFKNAVADPEGEAARAQARSKITLVNGQAPTLKKLL